MSEEDDLKSPTSSTKLRYASSNSRNKTDVRFLSPNEYSDEEDDTDIEYSRSTTLNYEEPSGEWIECQEIVSGRHLFYNSITLEIAFDDDPTALSSKLSKKQNEKKKLLQNGDSYNIASDDIADDEIASYLLKFDESKWDFQNKEVAIYRLQSESIDHRLMLPHPISQQFPEFFSTNTIPKKEQFIAEILPPKDNTLFPTTSKQWKVRVIVAQTTAKELIDKIVEGKLRISLNTEAYDGDAESIGNRASEFILKVVGCEEYILYDDTKLIVDYEAVRKAVRNEDDVIFQLDHRPDLHQIEKECFERNIWHIMQFSSKYCKYLTDETRHKYRDYNKYVKYGFGEGMSLDELTTAARNNGFTKLYQLQQDEEMKKLQQMNAENSDEIPPPPPPLPITAAVTPPHVSETPTIAVDDVAAIPSPLSDKESEEKPTPLASSLLNTQEFEQHTRQRSSSKQNQAKMKKNVENVEIMNQFLVSMKTLRGGEILNHIPSLRDTQYLESSIGRVAHQIRQKREIREMLLYEFRQFYRIKMSFMTNVTQLPRYKHYLAESMNISPNEATKNNDYRKKQKQMKLQNKKLSVIVRHELWIGDLRYDLSTFETDYRTKISDGMRFENAAQYFQSKQQKWCDLARESCISFTVFLCKINAANVDKLKSSRYENKYEFQIPIAFARFPIIDACNVLRAGKYALNLWPIPVYVAEYKGLKCDPYENLAFRYRGTTTDRHFKMFRRKVSKIDKLTGQKSGKSGDDNKLNVWKLGIEFESRKFEIIAPPLNHRATCVDDDDAVNSSQKIKRDADRLSRQATESFNIINNLPNERNSSSSSRNSRSSFMKMFGGSGNRDKKRATQKDNEWQRVMSIVNGNILDTISVADGELIYKYRNELSVMPSALSVFLRCVDWRLPSHRCEAYNYLSRWTPSPHLEDSLELLSYEFMDTYVREFGVQRIASMHDSDLQRYLLQLVQCCKYELHHNNALIRLLMRRALSNPHQIGHFFFWHLFSEYDSRKIENLMYLERFGLYLEEFLLFSTIGVARDIAVSSNLCRALSTINSKLRLRKREFRDKSQRNEFLHRELDGLNARITCKFGLPINPRWRCTHFVVNECKTMDSAQMPLWLSCKNIDDSTGDENTQIIFKTGDDLRQDILTLQILRVMDKIWLDRGLNLRLLPYNVVSTGDGQGMVQIVLCARTTTYIHTTYGGGAQKGARDSTTHLKYLRHVNNNQIVAINRARDIYTRSCAGYCIASYVLGLGDRHPSNIMVRNKGELFHIDFAHFLGNFKSQNLIGEFVKWQREVAPFVFLPAYKYCINNANRDDAKYQQFVQFAVNAYLALRLRHRLLCNLFILMLPSQMPELIVKKHIKYLTNQLHLFGAGRNQHIKSEQVYQHITKIINVCLNDKRRIIDNTFHAIKHQ